MLRYPLVNSDNNLPKIPESPKLRGLNFTEQQNWSPCKKQRNQTRLLEAQIKYETYSMASDDLILTNREFVTPMSPMCKRSTPNTATEKNNQTLVKNEFD